MTTITAGVVIIGDEILSGRTKDKNTGYIADYLSAIGIDLSEVRIVSDEQPMIVEAVNALRERYTYVFTSGGIGPTHDDITAEAIAAAFGVACVHDEAALKLLETHYAKSDMEFTDARKRMARMPVGASHIDNPVSKAPGFKIGNVHVMAGVPKVMQAMMDSIGPTLRSGVKMLSVSTFCPFGEGTIGGPLADIQKAHPDTMIGSYPKFESGNVTTDIVVRGRDQTKVDAAVAEVKSMLDQLANTPNP